MQHSIWLSLVTWSASGVLKKSINLRWLSPKVIYFTKDDVYKEDIRNQVKLKMSKSEGLKNHVQKGDECCLSLDVVQ